MYYCVPEECIVMQFSVSQNWWEPNLNPDPDAWLEIVINPVDPGFWSSTL